VAVLEAQISPQSKTRVGLGLAYFLNGFCLSHNSEAVRSIQAGPQHIDSPTFKVESFGFGIDS